ncbi:MAG TPA: hypothetical protein VGI06_05120 [Acidimicrobiales bacterium]
MGGLSVSTPAAWAAGNSGSATGTFIDFGGSFPGIVPDNCPAILHTTDDLGLFFISGNTNQPGGNTVEGYAAYVALDPVLGPVVVAIGHAATWGDQKGFTATFVGATESGQTLDFHMVGNTRSLQQLDTMRCS